jgi:hypothetical protein
MTAAVPDPEVVATAWASWRDEVAFAERFMEQAADLELTALTARCCARSLST